MSTIASPRTESRPGPNDPGEFGGSLHAQKMANWRRMVEGARALRSRADGPVKETPPVPVVVPGYVPLNMLGSPSWRAIVALVALRHGVSAKDILGRGRSRPVVVARQEAIGLVATHCRITSLPHLGRMFGRDHTTILYTLKKLGIWRPVSTVASAGGGDL